MPTFTRRSYEAHLFEEGAEGGSRPHTPLAGHRILSPARLPVPPLRLEGHSSRACRLRALSNRSILALVELQTVDEGGGVRRGIILGGVIATVVLALVAAGCGGGGEKGGGGKAPRGGAQTPPRPP